MWIEYQSDTKTDHNLILVVQNLKFWRVQSFWDTKSANKNHWIPEGFPKLLPVFLSKLPIESSHKVAFGRTSETAFVVSSSKAMLVFQGFCCSWLQPVFRRSQKLEFLHEKPSLRSVALVFSGQLMKEMGKNLWNPRQKKNKQLPQNLNITTDKKVEMENLIWVIKSPHVRNQASGHQAHLNRSKP